MFSIGMQTCICTVSLLVFVAESSALEQIEAQPRPFRALFTEAVVQDIERTSTDDTVMRDRPVVVDVKWLQDLGRKRVGVIGFNFFDDASFCGIVERVETGAAGTLILFGQLSGEHHGSFTVAVAKEVVIGEIRLPDIKEHYQIGYLAKGIHVVREIDDSRFPPCAVEHEHGLPGIAQNAAHDGLRGDLRDGPALIDVMVLYTPRMRLAAGGTEAVDAIIDLIIAESNAAYANSLIDVELRLAQAAEIDYDESGAYIDHLFRLTDPGDGVMDEIHALRDLHRADMVSLLVRDATSCGIAFMMTDLYSGFDNWTFSVVTYTCALAQYTFTHELGHNMGCAHNRANASTQGLRDYSYGYWEPESLFRTVMAYNCPGGCPRVDHFSNPDINYMGRPTGVPPGGPDSAYNAQSINISAPAIACYRISEDCNDNGIPDDQDIAASTSTDCNLNGYPDECEYDCNYTGVPDDCDIGEETSEDCDGNWIPDECDIALGGAGDCNFNSVPDHCDVFFGHSPDVDGDFIPDER